MRGGKRPGSGRKQKFGEKTTTIAFRVPISKVKEIYKLVNNFLRGIKGTSEKDFKK